MLPATSSDLVSMDRELISAQHDRASFSSPQQPNLGVSRSKPSSLLSINNDGAAGMSGSFASYNKLQGVQSGYSESLQMQRAHDSGMGLWDQKSMNGTVVSQMTAFGQSSGGRHTHNE